MTFSERQGLKPIRQVLQTDSMDEALRSRLWNVLANSLPSSKEGYKFSHPESRLLLQFCQRAWHEHFKRPIDTIPEWPNEAIKQLRTHFFKCEWYEVYDLMEFVEGIRSSFYSGSKAKEFNEVLAAELSAYRFVEGKLVPISSEQDNRAIEQAIAQTSDRYSPTSEHLKQAVALLARKPIPDYRNSIKESISAVEAICAVITGDSSSLLNNLIF